MLLVVLAQSAPLAPLSRTDCTCPQVTEFLPERNRATKIAVCAMFHNEARDIFEWIMYHWLLGLDHFVLYDNESTDAPERVLAPFMAKGIVTLKKWPGKKGQRPTPQSRSLEDCKLVAQSMKINWLAAFDIDEFLVLKTVAEGLCVDPRCDGSFSFELRATLNALEKQRVAGIIANRFEFGTNGLKHRDANQLQTTTFTRRSLTPSIHGKPLSLVRKTMHFSGFHKIVVASNWSVTMCRPNMGCPFQFFHYKTRSLQECIDKSADSRLPAYNWRVKAGEQLCRDTKYTELLDVSIANSSLMACVTVNAVLQRHSSQDRSGADRSQSNF